MDTNANPTRTKRSWTRYGLVAGGLAAALAGAVGIAWAAGLGPGLMGHGPWHAGMRKDFVEFRIHRALQQVDASDAQEQQILAIVDGLFAKHQAMAAEHERLHQRVAAALAGPAVDRAALEAVRAEAVQRLDQASTDLVTAIADAAEVLTPAQRQQLVELHRQQVE